LVRRNARKHELSAEPADVQPESTIVHWHGLHVPDDMDGHPRFSLAPGER
jgi:FtsP/CotA-like multicopper oxidase with cupredoxin domain